MEKIILIHGSGHRVASWKETVSYLDNREDILCPELSSILGDVYKRQPQVCPQKSQCPASSS